MILLRDFLANRDVRRFSSPNPGVNRVCIKESVLMADSQPLDEFTIDKVHWKSWAQSMQIGMRNKVLTKMTMTFHFPDTGVERSLSFVPSFACMKEVHASIPVDDDDKVMEFNDYHLDYKTAVEQKIQHRKAKSAQHKVNSSLCSSKPQNALRLEDSSGVAARSLGVVASGFHTFPHQNNKYKRPTTLKLSILLVPTALPANALSQSTSKPQNALRLEDCPGGVARTS